MDFKTFVHIVYIEGYCFFKKSNITQYEFTKTLLERSVEESSKIDIVESTLKGYIGGAPYHTLSKMMINAGMNKALIKNFFEEQFAVKHKNTPTYKERFHGQTYKETLHEIAKKNFQNITLDNLSDVLADCFCKVFYDDLSVHQTTSQPSSKEMHSTTVDRYFIDEKEKEAIINSCRLVLQALGEIMRMTNRTDTIQWEIKNFSSASDPPLWKEHLQFELDHLISKLEKEFVVLGNLCSELISLLEQKKHLYTNMAKLSEITHKLIENSNRFKITSSEGFRYSALSNALSEFEKYYNKLKRDWNTV